MEKTFEASLDELENIVKQLENGDLALEDSLKLFEQGVKLSRECRERLTNAERRIEVLMKDENGKPAVQPLEPLAAASEPAVVEQDVELKVSKRIVFDGADEDDEPF